MFKLALITGATSGIGEALATRFAKEGMDLILTGRSQRRLELLKDKFGDQTYICADLAKKEERKLILDAIHCRCPDLIVNNAGFGLYGEALTYPTHEQMEILEVNGNALLEISLEAARTLITNQRKGVIFNVSSAGGAFAFPCFSVYAASKAFVTSFSEAFDDEVRPHGVRCLVACPGMVKTGFRSRAGGKEDKKNFSITMPVEEAVEQIWWQIQKQKPVHTFNWRIQAFTKLGQSFIPKKTLMKSLRRAIESRIEPRTFIPTKKL